METKMIYNEFKVYTTNNKNYFVKTKYSEFQIIINDQGIGIYMDCEGLSLIKSYGTKTKLETAINYLIKKYFI